jgi:hypothetical protein
LSIPVPARATARTWLWSAEGDNRMVMTMTTDYADRLIGR